VFETALPPWAREFDTPSGSLLAHIHDAATEFDTHVAPSLREIVETTETTNQTDTNDDDDGGGGEQTNKKPRP